MPSLKTKSKVTHVDPQIKIKSLHSTLSGGITNDKWRLEHLSIVKLAQNQQHAILILLSLRIVLFSRTAAVWQYVIKQIRYVMTRDSSRPKCLGGAGISPPSPSPAWNCHWLQRLLPFLGGNGEGVVERKGQEGIGIRAFQFTIRIDSIRFVMRIDSNLFVL